MREQVATLVRAGVWRFAKQPERGWKYQATAG